MTLYKVTRKFIGGTLEGLEHTETTTVKFAIGFVCENPIGGSPYKVVAVEPITVNCDDVSTITEYGLTQKLSSAIRVF